MWMKDEEETIWKENTWENVWNSSSHNMAPGGSVWIRKNESIKSQGIELLEILMLKTRNNTALTERNPIILGPEEALDEMCGSGSEDGRKFLRRRGMVYDFWGKTLRQ